MHSRKSGGLVLLRPASAPRPSRESAPHLPMPRNNATARVRKLLGTGVDVNAAQVDGTTALHWAAYHDDAETVALLLRAGANANAVNRYGVPPLAQASTNGNAAIVKLLLDAGANANATMKGGESVLMLAARSGNIDAVKALLAHGAEPKVTRTARSDGPDVGGGRGAHCGGPRADRCRSRDPHDA